MTSHTLGLHAILYMEQKDSPHDPSKNSLPHPRLICHNRYREEEKDSHTMLSPTFRTDPAKYSPSVSPYLSSFYREAVTRTFSKPETVEIHRHPDELITAATTLLDTYITAYSQRFDSMEDAPWYPAVTAFVKALVREVGVDRWDDRTGGVMNTAKSATTAARKARMSLVHTKAPTVSAMQVAISAHIAWDYTSLDEVTAAFQSLTTMMTS